MDETGDVVKAMGNLNDHQISIAIALGFVDRIKSEFPQSESAVRLFIDAFTAKPTDQHEA
jgi:S-adenosylmethionine synthetase